MDGEHTAHEAVATKTLADQAYQRIRRDIIAGRLAPGVKLRLETLTQKYQVGMTPLREALARLVGDALVVSQGQRGFWVASLSADELADISYVRGVIECAALERSIQSGGPEWEAELRRAFGELSAIEERAPEEGDAWAARWEEANRRFHEALISACGSPTLIRLRNALHQQAERYRRVSLVSSGTDRSVHEEHTALFEAAIRREVVKACRVTELHLRRTVEVVQKSLESAEQRKII